MMSNVQECRQSHSTGRCNSDLRFPWWLLKGTLVALLAILSTDASAQENSAQVDKEPAASAERVAFADVSVVLNEYCAGCHTEGSKEADFSVDSYATLKAGTPDGSVLVPGKPDESKLLQMVEGKREPVMPPVDELQPSAEEIALLRAWIAQGAEPDAASTMLHKRQLDAPELPPADQQHHLIGACCAVGPDSYAVGSYGRVELRELGTDRLVWAVQDLAGKVNSLRLGPDGKRLVIGGGTSGLSGEVLIVDVRDGTVLHRFEGHSDTVYSAALSPDGTFLASGSYDRRAILWNVTSGEAEREFLGHNGAIYDLDFDPSGHVLATASADQTVKLWNVQSGERIDTLGQPEGEQRCVRFSSDGGSVFAAGADRQIRRWSFVSGARPGINPMRVARFAHESDIVSLERYGSDALVSASVDRTAKLWTTDNLAPLKTVARLDDVPAGVCVWSADNGQQGVAIQVLDLRGTAQNVTRAEVAHLAPPSASTSGKIVSEKQTTSGNDEELHRYQEQEPNNELDQAMVIQLPSEITGVIDVGETRRTDSTAGNEMSDVDLYRFQAEAGSRWIFEVNAARSKSDLDSFIDILDVEGESVLQTRLQAMRESYFTFRGKDSSTSDDFRMHKWEDMELDEYLYSSGEVNRLWLYPRGPDSGFKVYPGFGSRYAFFDTTPLSHALGEPAYIVRPLAPGEEALPNGLPIFNLYFENDDDSLRRFGKDSRLTFVAPRSGEYFLRVRDARGFGGENFRYTLTARSPEPDFSLSVSGQEMSIPVGSGREWSVRAVRTDGLNAPIEITLEGLPAGVVATNPVVVEAGQETALGAVFVASKLEHIRPPSPRKKEQITAEEEPFEIRLVARAIVDGEEIVRELPDKLLVTVAAAAESEVQLRLVDAESGEQELRELTIRAGETVSARVVIDRHGFEGSVSFGKEDSGRNLPHGAFVDNIGLNGLLITEQRSEREFFITAAPKLAPGKRQFHLRSETKGNPTSRPIWLKVVEQ